MFTPSLKGVSNESHNETGENDLPEPVPPLTLSENSKTSPDRQGESTSVKAGWGKSGKCPGYSLNARRKILRAGGAIDKVIEGPGQCLFMTGTLPGGTEDAKRAIAEWSGYAIQGVQAWIGNHIKEKLLIYCWEFQKRGALHLHLTVVCRDRAVGDWMIENWKAQWTRMIDGISARSGVNCWEREDGHDYSISQKQIIQTDAQWCTKSAAAYLSKYLSKGNLVEGYSVPRDYHPSRYWGVSRPLNALVDEMTETVEVEISRDYEASATFEEILSIAQSGGEMPYTYSHGYTGSRVLLYYSQKQEAENTWKTIKYRLMTTRRFYWQTGTVTMDSRGYLVESVKTMLPSLISSRKYRSCAAASLRELLEKTSEFSKLTSMDAPTSWAQTVRMSESIYQLTSYSSRSRGALALREIRAKY